MYCKSAPRRGALGLRASLAAKSAQSAKAEHIEQVFDIQVAEVRGAAEAVQPGMTVAVIGRPFLIIREYRIGLIDLFEAFLGIVCSLTSGDTGAPACGRRI